MNKDQTSQHSDPDEHKGAVEGDRPDDPQTVKPNSDGINEDGLPDDPVATAEDRIGANVDETQG